MENYKEKRALNHVCNLLGDMESQREWAVDKQSTGKRKHSCAKHITQLSKGSQERTLETPKDASMKWAEQKFIF